MFSRGQIVQATETLTQGAQAYVEKGKWYVVNSVSEGSVGRDRTYIKILGDDNQGHDILATLFKPIL